MTDSKKSNSKNPSKVLFWSWIGLLLISFIYLLFLDNALKSSLYDELETGMLINNELKSIDNSIINKKQKLINISINFHTIRSSFQILFKPVKKNKPDSVHSNKLLNIINQLHEINLELEDFSSIIFHLQKDMNKLPKGELSDYPFAFRIIENPRKMVKDIDSLSQILENLYINGGEIAKKDFAELLHKLDKIFFQNIIEGFNKNIFYSSQNLGKINVIVERIKSKLNFYDNIRNTFTSILIALLTMSIVVIPNYFDYNTKIKTIKAGRTNPAK